MFALNYRDARPIYAQICDGMRQQILSGILQKGERLPSVRELAGMLTINPNTIQRSYRQLEVEGWIATVPGKGCFVCDNSQFQDQEQLRWYSAFDEATTALIALGVTKENLMNRIQEGGK